MQPRLSRSLRPFAGGRLRVTPLGIGIAALGRPGYINVGHGEDYRDGRTVEHMEQRAFAVLDAAWDAGVRYFDAARSYGRGEAFLGAWLRQREVATGDAVVASKWGYRYTADWRVQATHHEVKEHSLAVLRRQWRETWENLGAHLDLYQIHSATFDSGVLENREVHRELARLQGKGALIGLTLSGPRQAEVLERAVAVEVDGDRLFDAVQATWNPLEPSAGIALADAHAEGLGVIVKEALANGRLTDRNRDPGFATRRRILADLAARFDVPMDAVALAAALARPWADVVLSGAATVAQIESNLRSLDIAWDARAESEINRLAEAPDTYWQTRSELAWN
jgi:aryl-alcohol dehydrogenase-like predicted oxidoreductase